MNARKAMSHEQAVELLPWLVTGAMDETEKQVVREHALACVVCRRELQDLELINELISQAAQAAPLPPPDMRRINALIDRDLARRGRVRGWLSALGGGVRNPWRLAFAVQTVLVLALAVVLLWPEPQSTEYESAEFENAEFTTLAQPQDLPAGLYVRAALDPEMSTGDLANLLAELNLTIADGPSARGVYTFGAPQTLSADERERLVARLQRRTGVLFAQWVEHR